MYAKVRKGIVILAPIAPRIRVADENGDEHVIAGPAQRFRPAYVFDVAQTDGDEPPTVADRLHGNDTDETYTRPLAVAASIGFTVEEDYLDGGVNGDCNHTQRHIRVEVRNEPAQQVKTLSYELAHALLHGEGFTAPREIAELEAESVSFIVMSTLGVDSGEYSFGYCASWAGGGPEAIKAIIDSGQRIVRAARQIVDVETAVVEEAA
jgi:hypothetical protein